MEVKRVVCAVIMRGNKIFATQRGYGEFKDKWEFPGGKIEAGETPEQAIVREIREELATEVEVERFLGMAGDEYPSFSIEMECYLCRVKSGNLELLEHESARWLDADHIYDVDWLPADEMLLHSCVEPLLNEWKENIGAGGWRRRQQ